MGWFSLAWIVLNPSHDFFFTTAEYMPNPLADIPAGRALRYTENMYPDKNRTGSVVVLMPDKHMGNLIVSLFSIKALEHSFAGKKFTVVVDERYKDIAGALIHEDKLLLFPSGPIKFSPLLKKLLIFLGFLGRLRDTAPDLAVDLHGGRTSGLLTFLSGARLRAGHTRAKRHYLYNMKVNLSEQGHKAESYAEIARFAGAEAVGSGGPLRTSGPEKESLRVKLADAGISMERKIICIHAGAGKMHKQWTSEGFASLSDWLSSLGFQVVFVGGGRDRKKTIEVLAYLENGAFDLVDRLTVGELMALFGISSLFIGNDSGPMHLAAATGTPVAAFFGPSVEKRWGPLARRSVILRGEARCEVCLHEDCREEFKCISSLKPGEVKSAVEELLESVGAAA
jgi:ADP-heptose:LPS heptosyltransferase